MKRFALLVLFTGAAARSASAQTSDELIARLSDPNQNVRSEALVALSRLDRPSPAALIPIADRLLDDAEDVRVTAAYSLSNVATKLGCDVDELSECKILSSVLDTTPKKTKTVPPAYPDALKRERIQGTVRVAVLIRADGSVADIRPAGAPSELHSPAIDAVKRWVYKPATYKEKSVPFAMSIKMNFRLR